MQIRQYKTNVPGEHCVGLPFYDDNGTAMRKMRMYCIELPDVQPGEFLILLEEHVVSGRVSFPGKHAFTAAQFRFGDYFDFYTKTIPAGIANGFDITPDNPYALFSKNYVFTVPPGYSGTQYLSVVGWASSYDAKQGEQLELVKGYGHLSIVRFTP